MNRRKSVEYEILVKKLFSLELAQHVPFEDFQIFHDKKYPGKSGHNHQIDVAAELKLAGIRIVILVECKLYSKKVGIDDIMEFATRLEDIGAHKGIVVTTVGFQKGAVRIAKSKGIALVKACDLGWIPHCESPIAAEMRHRSFVENARIFLSWFLGSGIQQDVFEEAVNRVSSCDVVSPLGVRPYPFCSLRERSERRLLGPVPGCMFAPPHGFIVLGEDTQIILHTVGLLVLIAVEQDIQRSGLEDLA